MKYKIYKSLISAIYLSFFSSCTVQLEQHKGFIVNEYYLNNTELFIGEVEQGYRSLGKLRSVDKNYKRNILSKGSILKITEIYERYPDSSGVTYVLGKITSGSHKGSLVALSPLLRVESFDKVKQ